MGKIKAWFAENKKTGITYCILGVLIMMQFAYLIYSFTVLKKGYHSDEIWTHGYANSYYQPNLNSNQYNGGLELNKEEWLPGSILNDYLTVNEGEEFAYGSIYYNCSTDLHPPFYYMVLHTLCSFMPGEFSWWNGFGINLVLFVLTQIFLFLTVRKLSHNNLLAILTCALYGFSQGGENTFIFVRMYAMSTFFVVLTTYLHCELYDREDGFKKILPIIFVVTFLGGFTHYFFLIYACVISACFCFNYLFKKQYKKLLIYAVTLLGAVGVMFLIYPYAFTHLFRFTGTRSLETGYGGFWFELRFLVHYMCYELFGIYVSPLPTYFMIYAAEAVMLLVLIGVPVSFLLRKEQWFKDGVKNFGIAVKKAVKEKKWLMTCAMIFAVIGLVVAVAITTCVFRMGGTATRYVFVIYPEIMVLLALLFNFVARGVALLFGKIIRRWQEDTARIKIVTEKIVLVLLVTLMGMNIHINATENFYMESGSGIPNYVDVQELPREANYILLLDEPWLYNCFSYYLRGVEQIFVSVEGRSIEFKEELEKLESNDPTYFIVPVPGLKELADNSQENIAMDEEMLKRMQDALLLKGDKVLEILEEYEEFFKSTNISDKFDYVGNAEFYKRYYYVFRVK